MSRRTPVTAAAAVLLLPGLLACSVTRSADGLTSGSAASDGAAPAAPGTLFGASFQRLQGEEYPAALARAETALDMEVVRVFYPGLPAPWPGKAPDRDLVVSFKMDPAEVVDGTHDSRMREWFRDAPVGRRIHWVYWHEPENDTEAGLFDPEDFRRAFAHLSALADDEGPQDLEATVVLMSYSLDPGSGRDWRDWFPPADSVDVLAWDVYNRGHGESFYPDPADLFGPLQAASASVGKPYAVAELGSPVAPGDDGSERARWIDDAGCHLVATDARFAAWFDFVWNDGEDDYRLTDTASRLAWRGLDDLKAGDMTCAVG